MTSQQSQASQITLSKQIELASRPDGKPSHDNFHQTTVEIDAVNDGEFLVRNEWMSVDPYMRGRMKDGDSYVPPFQIDKPLEGGCIGKVVDSRNDSFAVGEYVLGNLGWRECWKSDG